MSSLFDNPAESSTPTCGFSVHKSHLGVLSPLSIVKIEVQRAEPIPVTI